MNTQKLKIAIVDDELSVLDITERFITKRLDSKVDTYSNPVVASKNFDTSDYDLVLLDLFMPQMNGIEILEQLLLKKPNQKILLTTAYHNLEKYIENYNQSNIDYIKKPFDSLSTMEKKIKSLLAIN